MELYDIITLDNGKDYVISKMLIYNEKDYLLLLEVDKDENLLNENLIVEKQSDNNGDYVRDITDEKLKQIISEKFAKMLLEDIK